ncbi:hypothetical protein B7P43_G15058 [Cryptotermes secundus]|uniref:Gustatory receptor n=1 Tax=Cryptotermes secundus TaxID=105785 RepID=A0A2J7QVQ7_9NEOP|nr:putative gustatory receptor 28a [Cryptotermes secundus]PNF32654.1 hypothetical protein B7P43_G15058 [Cryptotermes secundus]
MENTPSIQRELKHIYYMSKVVCLAPYSFSRNCVVCKTVINTRLRSNVTGFVWTLFMSNVMVFGLISGIYRYKNVGQSNPGIALNNSFCFPMNFVNAVFSFTVLFMKRFKFAELIEKLSQIDNTLCQMKLCNYTKCKNYFVYFMYAVCILLAMFMCYDILQVEERRYFVYTSLYRLAYLISVVLIMQFCHVTRCIQQRLILLRKEMSSVLDNTPSMILTSTVKPTSFERVDKFELSCVTSLISENPVDDSGNKYQSSPRNLLLHGKLYQVDKIITFRQIYNNIYDATQLINSVYGFLILLLFVRAAGGLITNIYHLVSITLSGVVVLGIENWDSPLHVGSLVAWILIFLSTIIVMTVMCQRVMSECKKIDDIIQKLLLQQSLRYDMLQQLKLFSVQITKNQIEFSAFCFFKVDMSLLFTILTSVTSYIIVLVQFK